MASHQLSWNIDENPVVEIRDSRRLFVIFDKNEMRLAEGRLQDWDYQEVTAVSQAGLKFLSKMDFRRDRAMAVTV
jgi:hypothetical protein